MRNLNVYIERSKFVAIPQLKNIDICSDCIIGAGAVVVKNITEKGIYVGVPACKT